MGVECFELIDEEVDVGDAVEKGWRSSRPWSMVSIFGPMMEVSEPMCCGKRTM